jgi:hypothetical protein
MRRWMAVLFVALAWSSFVHASLARKERPAESNFIPLKSILSFTGVFAKNDEFRITRQTEVLLDGRPCRYEQIPDGATIILLETVTNLSKEISRIHFRSPRKVTSPTTK